MKPNMKYTKDGKKVVVLGKLNSEEYIVQEIFVSAGQEVPGGENFVAKGLLDAPAESWKDKNLREKEANYDRRIAEIDREFNRAAQVLKNNRQKAAAVSDALFSFAQGTNHEAAIDTLRAFLSGEITHLFVQKYMPEIIAFDSNSSFDMDRGYIEGIKLISLYGSSKGDLQYKIHEYRDGSGGKTTVFPFTSYAAALVKAQEVCDSESGLFLVGERKHFALDDWLKINGIIIAPNVREKYEAQHAAVRAKEIAALKEKIAQLEGVV